MQLQTANTRLKRAANSDSSAERLFRGKNRKSDIRLTRLLISIVAVDSDTIYRAILVLYRYRYRRYFYAGVLVSISAKLP